MADDGTIKIACQPCTQRRGTAVVALETGRFTADQSVAQQYQVPVGIVGVRLLCPLCSKQSLFFPTIHHYTCEKCGHEKTDYVRGDVEVRKGQGLSFKDTFQQGAENKALFDELRKGSVGGWGSGG